MKTKQLTRTALLIALLVAVQYVTKAAGQFVTGSCVNLILAVAAALCGTWWAVAVALISPFCAFLLGIGTPIIQVVPAIAAGNAVFVLLLAKLGKRLTFRGGEVITVVIAAVVKFLVLWGLIVGLLLPLMGLPKPKVAALSAAFSWPQLITALIGGLVSLAVIRPLKKALKDV